MTLPVSSGPTAFGESAGRRARPRFRKLWDEGPSPEKSPVAGETVDIDTATCPEFPDEQLSATFEVVPLLMFGALISYLYLPVPAALKDAAWNGFDGRDCAAWPSRRTSSRPCG